MTVCISALAHTHQPGGMPLVRCDVKQHEADNEGQVIHSGRCAECPDGTVSWAAPEEE